ncbi:hypothetical protein FPY71_07220 [Aureimonas fodinaquatilis]|uniref:Uncharacterized protein n=1 Tax=Aureimonas fodinaquatilis TaxID=2565783 RepID=A0A5B0DU22_9HYPH|nr:hypothetical protein [Aureimonas fodinaquatilis]KAA0970307.1 hypothetical protein FPY71_07220 [Aureimonas fodinaquatilis]
MSQIFDYSQSQQDADELIREFGQVGAIRVLEERSDWDDFPASVTDHACSLVVLPIDLQSTGYDVAGTLIKSGDVQILVSVVGLTVTPSTVNSVVTANGVFNIVRVNTLSPSGMPVLHDIVGRR